MAAFTTYDPGVHSLESLVAAILTQRPGVTLVPDSIVARHGSPAGEASTISFFDGSLTPLNIGAGLLLTSGDPTPATKNTGTGYGVDAGTGVIDAIDEDLQTTVNHAFDEAGAVKDVTFIEFQIDVTDPEAKGLSFEVVFGSEEYPEFSGSSFVDVAGVYVNGVNYALFEGDPLKPLSVVEANLAGGAGGNGYFRNNKLLPIEYDGISVKLKITVPLEVGVNTIKIAVADTGDSILDSGMFIANMQAVNYGAYGISQAVFVPDTGVADAKANQTYEGGASGTTVLFSSSGGGQDVYDGGAGDDTAEFEAGLGDVIITQDEAQGTMTIQYGEGNSVTLLNVERLSFGDGVYMAYDTNPGDTVWSVYALLNGWFNDGWFAGPGGVDLLSEWVDRAATLARRDLGMVELADEMIAKYSESDFAEEALARLYANIVGQPADAATVAYLADNIGPGKAFASAGELFWYGAQHSLNTNEFPELVGSVLSLVQDYF